MTDKIVPLRGGRPTAGEPSSIPFMLRELADQFERGDHKEEGLVVVIPQVREYPEVFGYGRVDNIAVLLDLAHLSMLMSYKDLT